MKSDAETGAIVDAIIAEVGAQGPQDMGKVMGQLKAREAIQAADLVLLIIDASIPTGSEDENIASSLTDRPFLLVRNKIDRVPEAALRFGGELASRDGYVDISALTGEGIEDLKDALLRFAGLDSGPESDAHHPNQRQKDLLQKAFHVLITAADPNGGEGGLELIAVDLKDCERYFNQILGVGVEADVLDAIFSRFCIGK